MNSATSRWKVVPAETLRSHLPAGEFIIYFLANRMTASAAPGLRNMQKRNLPEWGHEFPHSRNQKVIEYPTVMATERGRCRGYRFAHLQVHSRICAVFFFLCNLHSSRYVVNSPFWPRLYRPFWLYSFLIRGEREMETKLWIRGAS